MKEKSKGKKETNQTVQQIFESYRDEMQKTLMLEDIAPHKFSNVEFVEHFERRVDRLDTLIALYADLLLTFRNWN